MGGKSSKEPVPVPESILTAFNINRTLYFWIILVITVVAVIGNILAIRSVIFRKYKYLQKTCIISLAISDLLTIIFFSMNNLDLLRKTSVTWPFGEFMCHYLPAGQVLGNLASSVALLVIALDRYHSVIHHLGKKWNPCLWKCLCGAFCLWVLCTGISLPVINFYLYFLIEVNNHVLGMCYASQEDSKTLTLYYMLISIIIFIPIIILFFWFNYKIAMLIWRHRKPPTEVHNNQTEDTENTSTEKAQISTITVKSIIKKKNVQMERKKRSFKIVLTLIFAFVGCRSPYWLFILYKQLILDASGDIIWEIGFITIALNLLNCALNPFLYTYLSVTIIVCREFNRFMWKTFCCFFSNADFEDYETGQPIAEGVLGYKKNNEVAAKEWDAKRNKVQFLNAADLTRYEQREIR